MEIVMRKGRSWLVIAVFGLTVVGLSKFFFVSEGGAQVGVNPKVDDVTIGNENTKGNNNIGHHNTVIFGQPLPTSNPNEKITVYLHRCTNLEKYDAPKEADIAKVLLKENFSNVKPGIKTDKCDILTPTVISHHQEDDRGAKEAGQALQALFPDGINATHEDNKSETPGKIGIWF
jgi:hypothetical protein